MTCFRWRGISVVQGIPCSVIMYNYAWWFQRHRGTSAADKMYVCFCLLLFILCESVTFHYSLSLLTDINSISPSETSLSFGSLRFTHCLGAIRVLQWSNYGALRHHSDISACHHMQSGVTVPFIVSFNSCPKRLARGLVFFRRCN